LSENSSTTGKRKILAEPTIAVTLGHPFSFHSGGELNTRNGGDAIEIGTRVRGIVNEHEGDSLLVAFKLAVGRAVMDARNPDTELVQTETLDLRTTMIVGKTKRIDCGRSKVLEIRVIPARDPTRR
jgi:hypothetical protein